VLSLLRHVGDETWIRTPQGDMRVVVLGVERGRVNLGFDAPKSWAIERPEMKRKAPRQG
jgi:carbon storage regulator CsrA